MILQKLSLVTFILTSFVEKANVSFPVFTHLKLKSEFLYLGDNNGDKIQWLVTSYMVIYSEWLIMPIHIYDVYLFR